MSQIYRRNPVLWNSLVLAVLSAVTVTLQSGGGVRTVILAVLAAVTGIITRAQVTPVIEDKTKVVFRSGRVVEVGANETVL